MPKTVSSIRSLWQTLPIRTAANHRIDFRRASARNVTGHQCHQSQQHRDACERYRVGRFDAEEHGCHQPRQTKRADQARTDTDQVSIIP